MGPTLKVSFLSLVLVALFLQCEARRTRHRDRDFCNNRGQCQKACPSGWMFYQDNCYGFFDEPLNWSAAEVDCQFSKRNAHLASFLNEKELKEIVKYVSVSYPRGHVWVGLYDPRQTGNWRWVDLAITSYLPWNVGEPNNANGKEFCGQLAAHTGYRKLNDASCSLELPYVCKYPL